MQKRPYYELVVTSIFISTVNNLSDKSKVQSS